MNIIESAIQMKKHHTDHRDLLAESKWGRLQRNAADKNVFLFGGTTACDFFLEKYGQYYDIKAVLDNDGKKADHRYESFSKIKLTEKYKGLLVKSPDELKKYPADEVVVIITSTNYYEEIAEQLKQMNILYYYALLLMEAYSCRYIPFRIKESCESVKKGFEKKIYDRTGFNQYVWADVRRFHGFSKRPIQNNKIVFMTFGKYMDHGKYIAEELLRQELPVELVWLVNDKKETRVPQGIRMIEFRDRESLCYELATAKIWVSDVELPLAVRKRKGQIYIQTKHWAGVTLKKFYFDAPTLLTEPAKVHHWKKDFRMIDYMITGSEFDSESCRRGFRFKKEIWEIGSPRSDIIFRNKDIKEKVYDYCGCKADKKLLLYAPTYRYAQSEGSNTPEVRAVDLDYERLLEVLRKRFDGEWKILLRLHPAVAKYSKEMKLSKDVIDVSNYDDVQELVAAAEIMISDYSSVMFETAFAKRPVFLFTTDYQEYIEKEYDLLIGIDSLPFPRAESNEELFRCILSFDEERYRESVGSFLKAYGVNEDGNASKRAAAHIKGLLKLSDKED